MHHYSPAKLPSESFTYDEVKAKLPELFRSVADATNVVNELKSRKTPREIEKLRLAHHVARAGVEAFYAHAGEGIRETDLAAEVNYAVLKQVGHAGIRYTYCDPPQITSGTARTSIADTMSNHATEKRLQAGDLVMLEFGVQADGYWADITRTLVVGRPTDQQYRMHEAILAAQHSAIAAYKPGESTGDALCQAAVETMRTHGFGGGINPFLGHGLGFAYHEDRPTLGPGENGIIQPGHVSSVEPVSTSSKRRATRRDASRRQRRLGREDRPSGDPFGFPAGLIDGRWIARSHPGPPLELRRAQEIPGQFPSDCDNSPSTARLLRIRDAQLREELSTASRKFDHVFCSQLH